VILSTVAWSVAETSGFAGLLNPIWLSLIWTKLSSPLDVVAEVLPKACELRTPPLTVQRTPKPAQARPLQESSSINAVVVVVVNDES
jgi:hypothetical protein